MIAVMGKGYGGFVALHTLLKGAATCGIAVAPLTDIRNLGECTFITFKLSIVA